MISKFSLLLASIALLISCMETKEKKPLEADYFGEKISVEQSSPVSDLPGIMVGKDTASVKLHGTIVQTCANKGCWMTVDLANGETVRVTFKDYGFFVPKEGMAGKKVVFDGQAVKNTTSIDELQHYAQDAGASNEEIAQINSAKEEYKFIAKGVAIL